MTTTHTREPQRWLTQQLQYTQEMEKYDPDGELQCGAEEDIAMEMFFSFEEHSLSWRVWYVLNCVDDISPYHTHDLGDVVPAIEQCLIRWSNDLKDKDYPDEDESLAVAKQLVILVLSFIHPELVEIVPPSPAQA